MGIIIQKYGVFVSWLIEIVNIVVGNFDVEGSFMFVKVLVFVDNVVGRIGFGDGEMVYKYVSCVSWIFEVMNNLFVVCLVEEIEIEGEG